MPIEKTLKNRWRITTGGAREVTVSYRVYSHEMTVRSNWVEADFAMLNGAPTYLTLVESGARPHDVRLELPAAWKTSVTGMPDAPDGAPHHYRAPDYDTLVDCPIVAGNPAIHRFTVDGKPHLLVDVGEGGVFDGERAARDLERIVQADKRALGRAALRQVRVLQRPGQRERRARAQELRDDDGRAAGRPARARSTSRG